MDNPTLAKLEVSHFQTLFGRTNISDFEIGNEPELYTFFNNGSSISVQ